MLGVSLDCTEPDGILGLHGTHAKGFRGINNEQMRDLRSEIQLRVPIPGPY